MPRTIAGHVARMTGAPIGLVMIAGGETETIETTDGAVAPGTPTPAVANLECRAVQNDAVSVTVSVTAIRNAEPLARDLETHVVPVSVLQLEAAVDNGHVREALKL